MCVYVSVCVGVGVGACACACVCIFGILLSQTYQDGLPSHTKVMLHFFPSCFFYWGGGGKGGGQIRRPPFARTGRMFCIMVFLCQK